MRVARCCQQLELQDSCFTAIMLRQRGVHTSGLHYRQCRRYTYAWRSTGLRQQTTSERAGPCALPQSGQIVQQTTQYSSEGRSHTKAEYATMSSEHSVDTTVLCLSQILRSVSSIRDVPGRRQGQTQHMMSHPNGSWQLKICTVHFKLRISSHKYDQKSGSSEQTRKLTVFGDKTGGELRSCGEQRQTWHTQHKRSCRASEDQR